MLLGFWISGQMYNTDISGSHKQHLSKNQCWLSTYTSWWYAWWGLPVFLLLVKYNTYNTFANRLVKIYCSKFSIVFSRRVPGGSGTNLAWSLWRVLLVNGRPVHHWVRVSQEVLLADGSCRSIYGDDGEAHLEDPAVHDHFNGLWEL